MEFWSEVYRFWGGLWSGVAVLSCRGVFGCMLYLLYISTACWADVVIVMDCYGFLILGGGVLRLRLVIVRCQESFFNAVSIRCSDFASAGIDLFEYLVKL